MLSGQKIQHCLNNKRWLRLNVLHQKLAVSPEKMCRVLGVSLCSPASEKHVPGHSDTQLSVSGRFLSIHVAPHLGMGREHLMETHGGQ